MPQPLHSHLKRGVDCDGLYTEDDIFEEDLEDYNFEQQAAKRRRIEIIAARCLQGNLPVILTASLKGPFNSHWNNPWTSNTRATGNSSDIDNVVFDQRDRTQGRATRRGTMTAKAKSDNRKKADLRDKSSRSGSSAAYRVTDSDLESELHNQDIDSDEAHVPAVAAPYSEENDLSGATVFFSANIEKTKERVSPSTSPCWLRRGDTKLNESTNAYTNVSPTRSHSQNIRSKKGKRANPKLTKPHVPPQSLMAEMAVFGKPTSSASATILLSVSEHDATVRLKHGSECITTDSSKTVLSAQHLPSHGPCERYREHADSSVQSDGAGTGRLTLSATEQYSTSIKSGERRPSREDIQQSAERMVGLMRTSSRTDRQPQKSIRQSSQKQDEYGAPRHDLVASPAPASSTGFVYRKIGDAKRTKGKTQEPTNSSSGTSTPSRAEPLIPTSQSLEASSAKEGMTLAGQGATEEHAIGVGEQLDQSSNQPDSYGEHKDMHRKQENCESYSTQAAMLQAQMEFQEDSFPMPATFSGTCRAGSEPHSDTPRPMLPGPSAAMTPLSTELDKTTNNKSILRDAPMSTQELFSAASPFAFSTIKKRHDVLQQSSLRHALLSNDDKQVKGNRTSGRSPTPSADRVPLKAKNITTSYWSFASAKGSQASQASPESLVDRTRPSISEGEIPKLDLNTSLGDFGRSGDMNFMNGFMHTLHDT